MQGIGFSLFLYHFRRNKSRLFQRWSCSVDRSCCMMAMWLSPSSGSVFKQNVMPSEVCTWPLFSNRLPLRDNCQRKTGGRLRHRRWLSAIMKVVKLIMLMVIDYSGLKI
ncbi:hypothetical protein Hanom_Chr14g01290071 [Helianthus anomalus]